MGKFEILEHKADLKIRVFGKTKKELFENALLGMCSFLGTEIRNQKTEIRKIKIRSSDLSSLLVDFLSEGLYLIQTNKEIYNKVRFMNLRNYELESELIGQKIQRFQEDIKAVTYHDLKIEHKRYWRAEILFDI